MEKYTVLVNVKCKGKHSILDPYTVEDTSFGLVTVIPTEYIDKIRRYGEWFMISTCGCSLCCDGLIPAGDELSKTANNLEHSWDEYLSVYNDRDWYDYDCYGWDEAYMGSECRKTEAQKAYHAELSKFLAGLKNIIQQP